MDIHEILINAIPAKSEPGKMPKEEPTQIIKALLKKAGMTERQAAQQMGTTPQNLNLKLKRGTIRANEFFNLCEIAGFKVEIKPAASRKEEQ